MAEKENPLGLYALAGDSHKGADDAAALPVRLDRYSRAHHRALDMADYARSLGHVKEARGLGQCGHYLHFRDYYQVGKVRLHAADFCRRHLLCPLCAIRRGAKLVQSYLSRLQVVQAEHPGLKAYLVTVTVKNGFDLAERFRHLHGSMRKMTQARRSYLRGNPKPSLRPKAFMRFMLPRSVASRVESHLVKGVSDGNAPAQWHCRQRLRYSGQH